MLVGGAVATMKPPSLGKRSDAKSLSGSMEKVFLGTRISLDCEAVLVVRGNKLKIVRKGTCAVRMEKLVLAAQKVLEVERERCLVACLENLDLEAIPAEFVAAFPNIVELNVSGNCVRRVHGDISKWTQLKRLNLYNNHLESLPSALFALTALESLYLRGNVLLPEQFQENSYYKGATQKFVRRIADFFAPLELNKCAVKKAIIVMLGIWRKRSGSMVARVSRPVVLMIAKEMWRSV